MAKSRKRSESPLSTPGSSPSATVEPTSSSSATTQPVPDRRTPVGDRQRIEQRAYELYLSRGGKHGSDWEDWLTAERELTASGGTSERTKP